MRTKENQARLSGGEDLENIRKLWQGSIHARLAESASVKSIVRRGVRTAKGCSEIWETY
jgi:hypothetical protein